MPLTSTKKSIIVIMVLSLGVGIQDKALISVLHLGHKLY